MDAKSPPSACKPFDSILVLRKVGSHTWVHLDLTLVRRNGLSLELPSLELPSSSRYTLYIMYDLLAHVVTLLQRQLLAFAEAIEGAWCMCTHVFKLWRAYSFLRARSDRCQCEPRLSRPWQSIGFPYTCISASTRVDISIKVSRSLRICHSEQSRKRALLVPLCFCRVPMQHFLG